MIKSTAKLPFDIITKIQYFSLPTRALVSNQNAALGPDSFAFNPTFARSGTPTQLLLVT